MKNYLKLLLSATLLMTSTMVVAKVSPLVASFLKMSREETDSRLTRNPELLIQLIKEGAGASVIREILWKLRNTELELKLLLPQTGLTPVEVARSMNDEGLARFLEVELKRVLARHRVFWPRKNKAYRNRI